MKICCVIKCKNEANDSRGMCSKHYRRFRKHGSTDPIVCSFCKKPHEEAREFFSCAGTGRKRIGKRRREYLSYMSMKARCTNPNDPSYPRYGGRGIKICSSWSKSFENFYSDMGPRPSGTSLDRIDNDGNYEPKNCRWATASQQSQNQRTSVKVKFFNKTVSLVDISEKYSIDYSTLWRRAFKYNMQNERLIRPTPKQRQHSGNPK